MSEMWPTARLGDHIEASLGKMLDAQKNKGQLQPYLGNSNVRWGRFDLTDLAQMKFESHEEERYGIRHGDLIVCEGGEPGRCAIWKEEISNMKIQKALHRIRPKKTLNNYYLLYWFMLAASTGGLEPYFTGTTIKHLTGKAVDALELALPPIAVQEATATVLKSLDDKIELNRRMNETLEAMARAIFQSWFVDFDPVRAKACGESADSICQRLGLTPELLALFPDSFVDSELGEIPASWIVESIGTLANVTGGSTPNTKETKYWNDGVHYWVTPKDLSRLSSPALLETERKVSDEGLAQIGSGLLKPGTVLLSSRAPIGYRAINEVPVAVNQGFIAMTPNSGVSKYFLLYWTEWAHDEIVSRANGSTFLEISKANFRPIPVVRPIDVLFEKFDQYVEPLYKRIVSNEQETRLLAVQRDSLLPKLLSGEVLVPAEEDTF